MPLSQQTVPIPPGEAERLAALGSYAILDTLPEQAYDDLTLLAGELCGTPVALISLVDSTRQWFKSRSNFDLSETPRYLSFCAHAILTPDELMVVPDAGADPRFAHNTLVTQPPSVRFYAGAPLVTSEGHALGTLCVLDYRPRGLSERQNDLLRALSRQVVALLELRRSNERLRRHQEIVSESQHEFEQYGARLREINAQLHRQSFTDGLTGLYNRRAFDLYISKAVADAVRGGQPLSLLMMDVDHFKMFNDQAGHIAGDEVLRQVAEAVQAHVRKDDIVARYGGEEFAVILPQAGPVQAREMAERLCAAVREVPWHTRAITVSVGVATQGDARDSPELLIAAADKALYQAKDAGRDRVCVA